MDIAAWFAIVGLLLFAMAIGDTLLARLPLSTSMLYLAAGAASSPLWLGWTALDLRPNAASLQLLAEVVVLLSLFTGGLKLSAGLSDGRWRLPLRLAVGSMVLTVLFVATIAWLVLDLPIGAAVLLGGILAPTDPVLASEVQVAEPGDRDRLRFALTGEAGLNDGTAFPFVLLGLGLLGLHDLGPSSWRFFALDVLWASLGGLGIGALLGTLVGELVLYLRRRHREAVGLDNFLALGLIGMAYGTAQLAHTYGFLAVFAAGVALRRIEQQATAKAVGTSPAAEAALASDDRSHADRVATHPSRAPAFMAHAVLSFNSQIERIGEVAAVIVIGMVLWSLEWRHVSWLFVVTMLVVVRPLSVLLGLLGSRSSWSQRALIGWFGIRGIGSLFYLAYALSHGVRGRIADELAAIVMSVVCTSIVVHGISVTPMMAAYERRKRRPPRP